MILTGNPLGQPIRRQATDRLSLACALRGIVIHKGRNSYTMVNPEGVSVTKGTINELWTEYHCDPAFCESPILLEQ